MTFAVHVNKLYPGISAMNMPQTRPYNRSMARDLIKDITKVAEGTAFLVLMQGRNVGGADHVAVA